MLEGAAVADLSATLSISTKDHSYLYDNYIVRRSSCSRSVRNMIYFISSKDHSSLQLSVIITHTIVKSYSIHLVCSSTQSQTLTFSPYFSLLPSQLQQFSQHLTLDRTGHPAYSTTCRGCHFDCLTVLDFSTYVYKQQFM